MRGVPSREQVQGSVTAPTFRLANWAKHREHAAYGGEPYPFAEEYQERDGLAFTRSHVFEDFSASTTKGVISAIKWGYPKGCRPGGLWQAFSDAFRNPRLTETVETLLAEPPQSAYETVCSLNAIISGVGTATTTKIAYFARLRVQEGHCLIYDAMVRRAIRRRADPDFRDLRRAIRRSDRDLSPQRQEATYGLYIESVNAAALRCGVDPDQIELFLFQRGRVSCQ